MRGKESPLEKASSYFSRHLQKAGWFLTGKGPAPPARPPEAAWQQSLWKQQKRYVLKTIILTLALFPFFFAFFNFLQLAESPILRLLLFSLIFIFYVLAKALISGEGFIRTFLDQLTFIPVEYPAGEKIFEKRFNATYGLILSNVFIHYALRALDPGTMERIYSLFCFFPEELHVWNLVVSPITSIFLHADAEHLWFNMVALWVFGLAVEKRLGWKKFMYFYLLAGFLSSLATPIVYLVSRQEFTSSIGASGAIMGIMGVYAVRLFYRKLVFPVPLIPPIFLSFKVKVNSLLLIASYLYLQIVNVPSMFKSRIDYLAHIVGLLSGVYLASRQKIQDEAIEDLLVERATDLIDNKEDYADARKMLLAVVEHNPERMEAMVALARLLKPSEESRQFYERAIRKLLDTKPEEAARLFAEYFVIYREPFEPETQDRLTPWLKNTGKINLACRALEVLVDGPETPAEWKKNFLLQVALMLEKLELYEAALNRYQQLLQSFPDFSPKDFVLRKIEVLKKLGEGGQEDRAVSTGERAG
jgi:membrane associated rhomboid family serine protease